MIQKTSTRRRLAALASGALVAGGLVVAPAIAGLSTANAEGETLDYTCTLSFGGTDYPWASTVDVSVTAPEAVGAGSSFDATVDLSVNMGAHSLGPVGAISGSFSVPLSVGGVETVVEIPVSDGTPAALLFEGTKNVELTAPDTLGAADIVLGDPTGNMSASLAGTTYELPVPCVAAEGQDLTVGSTVVEEASEPVAVPVTGAVKITGKPKVGKTLKAVPGSSEGATVKYQWLSNGKPIKKATKSSLKLSKSLKGKKVSVRATYGKDGMLATVQTSKALKIK